MDFLTRPEFVMAFLVIVIGAALAWHFVFGSSSSREGSSSSEARPAGPPRDRTPAPAPPNASTPLPPPPAVGEPRNAQMGAPAGPGMRLRPEGSGVKADRPSITFRDVAGLEEAVKELQELRDYLANPGRFRALGAELPNGILLYGPPGNGKTLLARALAGEAHVPFYFVSASSFVEQYVGVGAARIRQLFEEAKGNAPAIVFIDELDAVGRRRDGGGNGDREFDHALNQLLVELDGSAGSSGVLILGATNRPELLDPALIRPGRFDRRIQIDPPDLGGREAILRLYSTRRPFDAVDWHEVATHTAGLSAAELTNLLNEASLLAARESRDRISKHHVDEALARVLAGPRSSRVMGEEEKRRIAVHEAGHCLLSLAFHGHSQPRRVSVVARGGPIGKSVWSFSGDRNVLAERELMAQLMVLLGGRAAEVHVFGEPSTRAEDDLEEAGRLARRMVQRWGMTGGPDSGTGHDALAGDQVFSGFGAGEVLRRAEQGARALIGRYESKLHDIAEALMEHETLTLSQITTLAGIRQGELDPFEVAA